MAQRLLVVDLTGEDISGGGLEVDTVGETAITNGIELDPPVAGEAVVAEVKVDFLPAGVEFDAVESITVEARPWPGLLV